MAVKSSRVRIERLSFVSDWILIFCVKEIVSTAKTQNHVNEKRKIQN